MVLVEKWGKEYFPTFKIASSMYSKIKHAKTKVQAAGAK